MQVSASRFVKHQAATINLEELRGWTPIDARISDDQPTVWWADFQNEPFSDPVFRQTIARYKKQESYSIVTTGFEALEALQKAFPGLQPNGFVFHVSHCGSTLLANMLRGSSRNLTLSEPESLNEVLASGEISEAQRRTWLSAMVSAYGQRRLGVEENFFIKFNSWALGFFPLIRSTFPHTPWICLYRHPVEIMSGQFKREELNTYWLVDQRFSGLGREARVAEGLAEILARTLGRYYDLILTIAKSDPGGICINYSQFSPELFNKILEHFKITPGADELEGMYAASKFYSKDPQKETSFEGDSEEKRREAYSITHEMAERWAMDSYYRLDDYRRAETSSSGDNHERRSVQ